MKKLTVKNTSNKRNLGFLFFTQIDLPEVHSSPHYYTITRDGGNEKGHNRMLVDSYCCIKRDSHQRVWAQLSDSTVLDSGSYGDVFKINAIVICDIDNQTIHIEPKELILKKVVFHESARSRNNQWVSDFSQYILETLLLKQMHPADTYRMTYDTYGYILMPYLGKSLYHLSKSTDINYNIQKTLFSALNLIKMLKRFRKMGYNHCDIKLDNILFDHNTGQFHLIDYGLAQPLNHYSTVIYLFSPPEKRDGNLRFNTEKAELYALAFVLAEYLFGLSLYESRKMFRYQRVNRGFFENQNDFEEYHENKKLVNLIKVDFDKIDNVIHLIKKTGKNQYKYELALLKIIKTMLDYHPENRFDLKTVKEKVKALFLQSQLEKDPFIRKSEGSEELDDVFFSMSL